MFSSSSGKSKLHTFGENTLDHALKSDLAKQKDNPDLPKFQTNLAEAGSRQALEWVIAKECGRMFLAPALQSNGLYFFG